MTLLARRDLNYEDVRMSVPYEHSKAFNPKAATILSNANCTGGKKLWRYISGPVQEFDMCVSQLLDLNNLERTTSFDKRVPLDSAVFVKAYSSDQEMSNGYDLKSMIGSRSVGDDKIFEASLLILSFPKMRIYFLVTRTISSRNMLSRGSHACEKG